jgi:hypothetical protein
MKQVYIIAKSTRHTIDIKTEILGTFTDEQKAKEAYEEAVKAFKKENRCNKDNEYKFKDGSHDDIQWHELGYNFEYMYLGYDYQVCIELLEDYIKENKND